MSTQGKCEYCGAVFIYDIFHNALGESIFAYCGRCGKLAVLDRWRLFEELNGKITNPTPADIDTRLMACECGGRFTQNAGPRCPKCKTVVSAEKRVAEWLKQNVPGASAPPAKQTNWSELYGIAVNKNFVRDNWRKPAAHPRG